MKKICYKLFKVDNDEAGLDSLIRFESLCDDIRNGDYIYDWVVGDDWENSSYKELCALPDFLICKQKAHVKNKMMKDKRYLAVAAKTSPIKRDQPFFRDFIKLNFYLLYLQYENAFYFLLGTPLEDVEALFQHYMDEIGLICVDKLNSLFILIQEDVDKDPQLYMIKRETARKVRTA